MSNVFNANELERLGGGASQEISAGPRRRGDDDRPGTLPAAMRGLVTGAVAGLVAAGWEAAIVGRTELGLPPQETLQALLALYAGTGAVIGTGVGLFRLVGARWALTSSLVLAVWLLSGQTGDMLLGMGVDPRYGPLILLPLSAGIAFVFSVTPIPDAVALGLAAAVSIACTIGLPINAHLLPSALTESGLLVNFLIGATSAVGGLLVGLAMSGFKQPGAMAPLALGGVAGWAFAWQTFETEPLAWPVATSDAHPPIVLVVIDSLRADHLGTYGSPVETSPWIDAWAADSIVYEDVTSAAPWTLPSFGSILTGRYPYKHRAGVNEGKGSRLGAVRPDIALLQESLREQGYVTAGIVTNPWLTASFGFQRGFDVYDDALGNGSMPVYLHPLAVLGLEPFDWPRYRSAEALNDRALSFVQAQEHSAWFLLLSYMEVHGPYRYESEDASAIGTGKLGVTVDEYDAAVHQIDRLSSVLLDALPPDAWVVVTSDHGKELLEHRDEGKALPEGVRNGHSLYQELLRVPLVVRAPGRTPARVARPVSTVDLVPTLLTVAGAPVPDALPGEPLVELVGGTPKADRVLLAGGIRYGGEQQAARRGPYKLIAYHGYGESLFDLSVDPGEKAPLAMAAQPAHAEIARSLRVELPKVGVGPVDDAVPLGEEIELLLERLGYAPRSVPDAVEGPD